MDTGDIIYQKKIGIDPNYNIGDLIKATMPLFDEGVVSSLKKMITGKIKIEKQDHSKATYSIWRDEIDLWIDWNESASRIERTIRALGRPYMGARTRLGSEEVIIQKSEVVHDIPFEIRQPGKVWKLTDEGRPIIVCGKDMLLIIEANKGDKSLIPMKKLRVRFQ
jgi:methionyl-tRNA formyltransferase